MKFSFGKCRTVPKNVKGGPFLIYKLAFCCKITKNSKGDPLGTLKIFEKKSHSAEKNRKGDPLVPSGFVGYLEKVKNERGDPLHSVFFGPLDGLGALGGLRIVSKKWIDQCEDCSLEKKQAGNGPSRRHI